MPDSVLRLTQDLAKEIAAIYEMEHREQLKEKAVAVLNEVQMIFSFFTDLFFRGFLLGLFLF